MLDQWARVRVRVRQLEAARPRLQLLDPLQDLRGERLAEPGELLERLLPGGDFQLVHGRHVELFPELPGPFRAQPGDVRDLHERGRDRLTQLA